MSRAVILENYELLAMMRTVPKENSMVELRGSQIAVKCLKPHFE